MHAINESQIDYFFKAAKKEENIFNLSSTIDSSCRKVTMSNILYPHLVHHPYFNNIVE